jgi:hypothetical protein
MEVARVEIDKDGRIILSAPHEPAAPNPYDVWKAKQNAS